MVAEHASSSGGWNSEAATAPMSSLLTALVEVVKPSCELWRSRPPMVAEVDRRCTGAIARFVNCRRMRRAHGYQADLRSAISCAECRPGDTTFASLPNRASNIANTSNHS